MNSFETPPIIAVAGGNGSGKTTIGRERMLRTEAPFADLGDIIRIEATNRGLDPTNREVLRSISSEWAAESNSPAVMAQKALEHFSNEAAFSVISIRRTAEAKFFQDLGGMVVWVDAPVEKRWKQVNERARDAGDTQKTLDEFIEIENKEMFSPDPSNLSLINMDGVRQMADVTFENTSETEEEAGEAIAAFFNLPPRLK